MCCCLRGHRRRARRAARHPRRRSDRGRAGGPLPVVGHQHRRGRDHRRLPRAQHLRDRHGSGAERDPTLALVRRESADRAVDGARRVLHDDILTALRGVADGRPVDRVRDGCRDAVASFERIDAGDEAPVQDLSVAALVADTVARSPVPVRIEEPARVGARRRPRERRPRSRRQAGHRPRASRDPAQRRASRRRRTRPAGRACRPPPRRRCGWRTTGPGSPPTTSRGSV